METSSSPYGGRNTARRCARAVFPGVRPMSADRFARAAVDRLDEIAHAMERKWGVDRLPKLVDPALASRFRAQGEKLNDALRSERPDAIAAQAAAMERAWAALDATAIAAGAEPLTPTVWETVLPSTGEVIAIVRTVDEASAVARDRNGAVYTLAEVAVAIDAFGDQVRAVKATFPGASVTAVRSRELNIGSAASELAEESRRRFGRSPTRARPRKRSAALQNAFAPLPGIQPRNDGFDWDRGDDIPF